MKIIAFIFLAIGVTLIGYIIAFITGFRIGKGKTIKLEKIKEEVCTRYCRYAFRNRNGHMSNKLFDDVCNRCPLNKLWIREGKQENA